MKDDIELILPIACLLLLFLGAALIAEFVLQTPDRIKWTSKAATGKCEVAHITGNTAVVDVKEIEIEKYYDMILVRTTFDQPALPVTKTRKGFFFPGGLSAKWEDEGGFYRLKDTKTTIYVHDPAHEYRFYYTAKALVAFDQNRPNFVHYSQVVRAGFDIKELREKLEKSDDFWDKVELDYLKDFNERGERVLTFWGTF